MKHIVEKYKSNIKSIIKNFTGNYNEDIEQEVYIRTWKGLNSYDEAGKFKSWICKITANVCRDYFKSSDYRNSRLERLEEKTTNEIKDTKQNPESVFISKQRQKRVIKAIDSLKPKLKQVIILYEIKGLGYEDVSKIIKCPVGTVKSRLYNARKELGIILKDLV